MKEVDSRLAMVNGSALLVMGTVLCTLLLLGACLPPDENENAANATTAGKNAAGGAKAPTVVSGKAPAGATAPNGAVLPNATPQRVINLSIQPCPVTPENVKDACGFDVVPVKVNCSFDAGAPWGAVAIERYYTNKDGYDLKWGAVPGTTLISDNEPFEATNEYQNVKYVWRFQGSTLIAVRASRSTCRLDSLRLLASMAMGGQ